MKLTRVQKRVLKYLADKGTVSQWPVAVSSRQVRNTLEANGLMKVIGKEGGLMGFNKYQITEAGIEALDAKENKRV